MEPEHQKEWKEEAVAELMPREQQLQLSCRLLRSVPCQRTAAHARPACRWTTTQAHAWGSRACPIDHPCCKQRWAQTLGQQEEVEGREGLPAL